MELTSKDWLRFIGKVQITSGCWYWRGAKCSKGYGSFKVKDRVEGAHRLSYEYNIGPILEELEIDHLCRVRECVNPTHLETVTAEVNRARGLKATRDFCINGHLYINNVYHYVDNRGKPRKQCLVCKREAKANYEMRHKV